MILSQFLKDKISDLAQNVFALDDEARQLLQNHMTLEKPANKSFGDFATNVAMLLSKHLRQNPRTLATQLVEKLQLTLTKHILETKLWLHMDYKNAKKNVLEKIFKIVSQ